MLKSSLFKVAGLRVILGGGFFCENFICGSALRKNIQSKTLIYLSLWVLFCRSATMMSDHFKKGRTLYGLEVILIVIVVCSFWVNNLINFFVFFELSLVPMAIIIMMWGLQPERIQASVYLLFYTIFASLPLLGCLMFLNLRIGRINYNVTELYKNQGEVYILFGVFLRLAFLVKVPIFGFHGWLTKAHVEAPPIGSMILASLLLKLGGFGLFRVIYFLDNVFYSKNFFYVWVFFSSVLVRLICSRNTDIKRLIAYSSVVHMAISIIGLCVFNRISCNGAIFLFVAHGICSSGLFMAVGFFYDHSGTRKILLNKNILFVSGKILFVWLLLVGLNSSLPPSLKYFREVCLFVRAINYVKLNLLFIVFAVFLNGLFKIFLYVSVSQGPWLKKTGYWVSPNFRLLNIGLIHILVSLIFVVGGVIWVIF